MRLILAVLLFTAVGIGADGLPAQSARVAIYRDTGVWANEGSRALPAVFEWLGHSYTFLDANAINGGALRNSGRPAFDLLVVPGGWAANYIAKVGGFSGRGPGDDEIRAFVSAGGNYLGFCAGAFAACSVARWLGRDYRYSWQLFDGRSEGPLPWNRLLNWRLRAGHGTAVLDLTAPELKGRGLSATVRPMLYGGQRFVLHRPSTPPANYRILAVHGEDRSAAIVSYNYPNAYGGRVVLSAFHPAVLTGDGARLDRDHDDFKAVGAGADPDGETVDWQLAAALVDVALRRPVRRVPALPRTGGTITVAPTLSIGNDHAITITQPGAGGADYALAASLGTVPGIRITARILFPLTADPVLFASLQTPAVFQAFLGRLDSRGRATARLRLPAFPSLRGMRLHFAFVTRDAAGWRATGGPTAATIQ